MNATLSTLPDKTLEITITIPWQEISREYEATIDEMAKTAELPGFRKGKAPRKMVAESLNRSKIYEEVIKHLVPKAYGQAVQDLKLKPFITPSVELKDAKDGTDWTIVCKTCEKPVVTLGEYKKAIRDLKASKAKKIWIPGQSPKPEDPAKEEPRKPTLDELLTALFANVTITLPKPMIDHEVNRLLSELVDQTQKLGLTVDQYLASTNRTAESVRADYEEQAKRTLTLEFALEAIAEKENITVSEQEIDTIIKTAKTDEEKKTLEKERYYLASIVRRQKTIDSLAAL